MKATNTDLSQFVTEQWGEEALLPPPQGLEQIAWLKATEEERRWLKKLQWDLVKYANQFDKVQRAISKIKLNDQGLPF